MLIWYAGGKLLREGEDTVNVIHRTYVSANISNVFTAAVQYSTVTLVGGSVILGATGSY